MPRNPAHNADALVLGGGLAGAAVATLLARSGRSVTLVEQNAAPHHKVCGEFLSAEALFYLRSLGLSPAHLGAVPITHVRLATPHLLARARLPFAALSLTRLALDEALLTRASESGVSVLRGHRSESLTPTLTGWQTTLSSGQRLAASQAILATGKHDLRAHPRPPGRQNNLLAFKQYLSLSPDQTADLDSHVELILFPGGYAGLQPVDPDPLTRQPRANLCLVVDRLRYQQVGASWPALLTHIERHAPHLAQRLAGARHLLPRPLALSAIPYGLLLPPSLDTASDTLWRLGDQTAVIPSFTGDGMSIALHTAHLAAHHLLAGHPSRHLAADLRSSLDKQIRRSTRLSQLLLTRFAAPLATIASPILPHLLRHLARLTRIPPSALIAPIPDRVHP